MNIKNRLLKKVFTLFYKPLSFIIAFSIMTSIVPTTAVLSTDILQNNSEGIERFDEISLPDIIEKEELEKNHYVSRIKEDENDLYTFVFKNEDGSNTMRIFSTPVKFIDENGVAKDISLSIAENDEGKYVTNDHFVKVEFDSNIRNGINLKYDDINVEMFAEFDHDSEIYSFLSNDERKLSYSIDDKTSYVYSLTYSGIKEDIVVSEYTGQNEYKFRIKTHGLHPVKIDDSVFLADDDENLSVSIGDIVIFTADEKNNALGHLKIEPIIENSEYIFTIILEDDYLKNEKTVYPLTIDPTIEINYNNNGAGGIEDITINSIAGSDGTSGSLYIGKRGSYGISRVLMKVPNLDLSNVANANDILSASVELRDLMCEYDSMNVSCYAFIGNTWSENNASWATVSPDSIGAYQSSNIISYNNGTVLPAQYRYSFNIVDVVKNWKTYPNNIQKGIIFKADATVEYGGTNIYKTFASYNRNAYRPSISIKYDPEKNYTYVEDAPIQYTYRNTFALTKGQTVTFSTGKATSYDDVDTVIHFFATSNPTESTSWANDNYNSPLYSQLTVTIPISGNYTLLVRKRDAQQGYCNVYQNGNLLKENAKLGGYILSCNNNVTGYQNFFTANSNNVDTILYVMDSLHRVVAYNDDYSYFGESITGDFSWGNHSRVHKSFTVAPSYVFVSSFSTDGNGTTDIYSSCLDGYYNSSPSSFPNLKAVDSINAANPSTDYNCIAWSGGIMSRWVDPFNTGYTQYMEPWYNANPIVAFDNYYGNNPPRYAGAITYVPTTNANEAIIDVYSLNGVWEHAAVRKPGNEMPHGYDWESKLGGNERIFHPRYSLEGGGYGNIARYYKIASSKNNIGEFEMVDENNTISFEQSVACGKTVLCSSILSEDAINIIQSQKNNLDSNILSKFELLFSSWVESINCNEELRNKSYRYYFTQIPEFTMLNNIVNEHSELVYVILDLYIQKQDIYTRTLFETVVVLMNERTIELANNIREKNNKISKQSIGSSVYIAPSFEANAKEFIEEVIRQPSYYYI